MKVRPTFTDFVVLLFVIFALASFASKYVPHISSPKYESVFSGSQIYSAVAFCENLEGKGFLYSVYVKGFFVSDYAPFEKEGFVVQTGRGNLTLKMEDGQKFSVGGRGSYLEDAQAERMVVRQKSRSTVIFSLIDFEADSAEEALQRIEDASSFIHYEKEDIAVSAAISIDARLVPSASEEARLKSTIEKNVFLLKDVTVIMKENGFVLKVEKMSIKGLSSIFSLLATYDTGASFFSDVRIFYQTSEEIDPQEIDSLEGHSHPTIVPGSIHVRV